MALRSTPPTPVAGSATGWTAQGGTPIVIAQGESLDTISSRYGVPRAALISANGLSGPNVSPGSRLVIPVYNGGGSPQVAQARSEPRAETLRPIATPASRPAPAPVRTAAAPVDAVGKARAAAEAKAEAKAKAAADAEAMRESRAKFAAEAKTKAEAKKAQTQIQAQAKAKSPVAEVRPAPAPEKAKPTVVASAPAEQPVSAVPKSAPEAAADPKTTASLPKVEEAVAKADFRWPARGRVIAGYSGKGANEGINIAVPEGTPVKAAEGGVVAYAGSELKGYGNLVLIRHPNGYVSAYAHNGELNVKRGESVKRGQVVAKSGQTGNVSSPQLHFELRKGASPVDPVPYLTN
ncbi:peptidoglycan DD-metalloendopeptidase family protein [Bosea sp. (in: a-proteobacteria)]|uniref:peptidoglycan DD-metalloendopeptidase family protein n=1 Tax=Bosea sp. (in: a-proteobacteria) TaxID=1871050 RepID=UPI003F6F2DF2